MNNKINNNNNNNNSNIESGQASFLAVSFLNFKFIYYIIFIIIHNSFHSI